MSDFKFNLKNIFSNKITEVKFKTSSIVYGQKGKMLDNFSDNCFQNGPSLASFSGWDWKPFLNLNYYRHIDDQIWHVCPTRLVFFYRNFLFVCSLTVHCRFKIKISTRMQTESVDKIFCNVFRPFRLGDPCCFHPRSCAAVGRSSSTSVRVWMEHLK